MSDDAPLFSKMDALLKKHRGTQEPVAQAPASATPPPAWLPVLTNVIERGVVPKSPPSAAQQTPLAQASPKAPQPSPAPAIHAQIDALIQSVLPALRNTLKQQLTRDMDTRIDEALATLGVQLEAGLRDLLRDASAPPTSHD